jgi:hypothetical protein
VSPAGAGLEHQRQRIDPVVQRQQGPDVGSEGIGHLAGEPAADAEMRCLLTMLAAVRQALRVRVEDGVDHPGEGLGRFGPQPHDTGAEPADLTERRLESRELGADPFQAVQIADLERVVEREQHRDV